MTRNRAYTKQWTFSNHVDNTRWLKIGFNIVPQSTTFRNIFDKFLTHEPFSAFLALNPA